MVILLIEILFLALSIAFSSQDLARLDYLALCSVISFGYSYFMVIKQGWYPDYIRYRFMKAKIPNKPMGVFKQISLNENSDFSYVQAKDGLKSWLNILLFCPYCITFRTFFYTAILTSQFSPNFISNLFISLFVSLAAAGVADFIFSKLPLAISPDE
jgi:hypothetical protein